MKNLWTGNERKLEESESGTPPPKGNDYTKTLMFYDAFIAD